MIICVCHVTCNVMCHVLFLNFILIVKVVTFTLERVL